jgi:3-hydroxyacyl-[acyl-carrier-protein] dehydratase
MHPVTELIPHRPPFLFVDEIVSASDVGLVAKRTWRAEEDFYQGHYPGAPLTPGVLLCEAVFQAAACYLALQARAAGVQPGAGVPLIAKISEVRFRHSVFPGDTILLEVKKQDAMGGFTMLSGQARKTDGTRVLNLNFSVAWKLPAGAPPS